VAFWNVGILCQASDGKDKPCIRRREALRIMGIRVKLSEIVSGMEFQTDESVCYLKKTTGETVLITDEASNAAEEGTTLSIYPQWEREEIEAARDIQRNEENYVALPSRFDMNEYSIMERFCDTVEDEKVATGLRLAIQGSGAFRRFKDGLHAFGIAEQWYAFRDKALREIAKDWCEENHVEYTED
jgi:hypothetical protein